MAQLNGIDVDELREFVASVERDTAVADRDPVVVARWAGGERAEVTFASGEAPVFMGGDGEPSAMKMVLAPLAACDVRLVANRAALLGVEIESVIVEATPPSFFATFFVPDATGGAGNGRSPTVPLETSIGAVPV